MKAFRLLATVVVLSWPLYCKAEQVTLSALKMRVAYRPEDRWFVEFDRSNGNGQADHDTAMEVLLIKSGKSKSVFIGGSVVPKGDSQFNKDILAQMEKQATPKDYRILTKEFTKFAGLRAYKVLSESPALQRQVLLYFFYSGDMEYAILAGSDNEQPIQSDKEIKRILDSIVLTK